MPTTTPSHPPSTLTLTDHRGRRLRVTRHPELGELVIISIWRGDLCVGTVQLGPEAAADAALLLTPPA